VIFSRRIRGILRIIVLKCRYICVIIIVKNKNKILKMLFITSQSFPHYGLARFFKFAKDLGVDGVEIVINSNFDTQDPDYLKKLSEEYKMPIKSFSLPTKGADRFIDAFEKVVSKFEGVTINLASPEILSFAYKKWMENSVPQLCKRFRLNLNRVTMPTETILGIIPARNESSLHMLRQKGSVAADLSALWRSTEDVMRVPDFLREKMRVVYLSNVRNGSMYASLPIGILPVESFLTKLSRDNFRGDFIIKLSPKNIHEGDWERMMEIMKESKEFFEKYFKSE
jgi:sugar phosphate isomerase/epimerase